MIEELKPCPFCGGEAKEFTGEDAAPHRWTVECDSCGAHVGSDTRHRARTKWNRRAERTCHYVGDEIRGGCSERREVARRLRSFVTDDSVYATVDASNILHALGLYYADIDRIYFCGYDVARLADLIEPSEPEGVCGECSHFNASERFLPCDAFHGLTTADVSACEDFEPRKFDRDALLALAEEMERDGAGALDDGDWCKPLLIEYARRIRDALGVQDA